MPETGTPQPPLSFKYEESTDTIIIEGIRYSGLLFRTWGVNGAPLGITLQLVNREHDGAITLKQLDMNRIRVGPMELACKKCGAKDTFTLDFEQKPVEAKDGKA